MTDNSFKLFKSFSDELDPERLQNKFLNALLTLQNVERGSIWIKTDDGYLCVAAVGPQSEDIKGVTLKIDQPSLVGWVIENGKMAIADPEKDGRHFRKIEENLTVKSKLILTFPLLLKENKVYGAVQLIDTTPEKYRINLEKDYLEYLQNLVDTGAVALGNAIAYTRQLDEAQFLKQTLKEIRSEGIIVGQETVFIGAMDLVKSYANSDFPVLITGESGTGKELMAVRLHKLSSRRDKPFLVQNCSTIPETLLESELFGYKKGAFSGALKDRVGLFEAADGGTVFLDEIGDMPINLQASILRVVQNSEIKPLGATNVKKVDIRIVSATNIDIQKAIEKEAFRSDLFYRLSVLPVQLPPLRERKNDIPLLLNHFIKLESLKLDVPNKTFCDEAMRILMAHNWPGNIRELENLVRFLLVSTNEKEIKVANLPKTIVASAMHQPLAQAGQDPPSDSEGPGWSVGTPVMHDAEQFRGLTWEDVERKYAKYILRNNSWNVTRASKSAGVNRSTFASRIRKLGINRE
ncbi:MAG: sigma-54-dependent Fis family transcriptional regulator [Proteobacteria bacterium]|nr:sigma-54-dependent Fis family transcriptional regulator [Pseudomonadota bacterium]